MKVQDRTLREVTNRLLRQRTQYLRSTGLKRDLIRLWTACERRALQSGRDRNESE